MDLKSRIPGFYDKTIEERQVIIKDLLNLSEDDIKTLEGKKISEKTLNIMIENVIGQITLPVGIATNFKVNKKDYLVPMVTEESSVVAAASNAAKIARTKGGFRAEYSGSNVIGQLQILSSENFAQTKENLLNHKDELLEIANSTNEILVKLGGGAKDIEVRSVKGKLQNYTLLHLIVDTLDAMGANAINTMLEAISPKVNEISNGIVLLKIISNYAIKRKVSVEAVFDKEGLGGEKIVDNILLAYDLADNDIYRAVTHNKGIMNGITSVMLATGNDTRAIEAGAHAYAVRDGSYRSLTRFEKTQEGDLRGVLEIPMSVGILGGAINVHPSFKLSLKILNVSKAEELAKVAGAVGLAQNVAALRALVSEGIQEGHMLLHARNVAVSAGATGKEIEKIAEIMISEKNINYDSAKKILNLKLNKNKK